MQFRDLLPDDGAKLLEFESANRGWFEKTVEARKEEFYSLKGIEAHIAECLAGYAGGTLHPLVMTDAAGEITGRANLRFIDAVKGNCEIGYRIAELHCGHGWASASVRHMQQLAYGTWGLSHIVAYASVENLASARVLEKNSFVREELIKERSTVHQRKIDAYRYIHTAA